MNNFEYIRPATTSDAVTAATRPGAAYLASGTNLLDLMKGGIVRPSRLVDITRLPGLKKLAPMPCHWLPRKQIRSPLRRYGFLMATRRSL